GLAGELPEAHQVLVLHVGQRAKLLLQAIEVLGGGGLDRLEGDHRAILGVVGFVDDACPAASEDAPYFVSLQRERPRIAHPPTLRLPESGYERIALSLELVNPTGANESQLPLRVGRTAIWPSRGISRVGQGIGPHADVPAHQIACARRDGRDAYKY